MTPKEKAEDLVGKFLSMLCDSYNYNNIFIAKRCALIAVDEVVAQIEPSVSMDVISARIEYWQQVKQEIKAITPDGIIRKYEDAE